MGAAKWSLPFQFIWYNFGMTLPSVFDSHGEPVKFMARMKDRAAKNFRWTSKHPLEKAMHLAYWSYVFGRNDDALQVCDFLSQFQFSGNYNLWTWIECSLALEARLLRTADRHQEAAQCVARIRAADFVETRLDGSLLMNKDRNINDAVSDGNRIGERDWRVLMMVELCVVIELGGSQQLPIERLEHRFQENLVQLQRLVNVSKLPA